MQTASSTSISLRPRADASPFAVAIAACAIVVFRYTRDESPALLVGRDGVRFERFRLRLSSTTTVGELLDQIRRHRQRDVDPSRTLTIGWSEPDAGGSGARLGLSVRLPSLGVERGASELRGLLATADPLADFERHFRAAIAAVRTRRALTLAAVPLLDAGEVAEVLDDLSRSTPRPDLLDEGRLHDLFAEQARARPDAIAIELDEQRVTYGALAARANTLAAHLRARGIGPGAHVGLLLPRGVDAIVAILGILGSGAAYVPLDPDTPVERTRWVLADCEAAALLTTRAAGAALGETPCPIVALDEDLDRTPERALAPQRAPTADDDAYVIYTSGSTGTPKGVAITHRSARHLVLAERSLFRPCAADRVLQGFSLAFDAAVEEVWLALAAGATLVVATRATMLGDLARFLAERRVTVFSTVPTLLGSLGGDLPGVRVLIVGGEACPLELVRRFSRPDRPLLNTYGPTEATVIATLGALHVERPVTIGRPIPNLVAYVLDRDGNALPRGIAGELHLGGVGVARGYVGASASSTPTRFVRNPFADRPGAPPRLYRTGDRARFTRDGSLEFLGRIDDQVKLRGFRIELGEIEATLAGCDGVAQAAAALHAPVDGEPRLVAYLVPRTGRVVDLDRLRAALRGKLPAYMVPSAFVSLSALPVLTSGKIDRRALARAVPSPPGPRPAGDASTDGSALAPAATSVVGTICRAWATLFGVAAVAPDAHFFDDLGGHSLLVARGVSLLRAEPALAGLSVLDVYAHPTAAALAATVAPAPAAAHPVERGFDAARVRAGHLACAVGQLAGSYVVFALHAAQWLAPWLAYALLHRSGAPPRTCVTVAGLALACTPPALLLLAVAVKWLVLGRYRAGRHPLWGGYFLRWWLVERVLDLAPIDLLVGTPWMAPFLRAMGARVGAGVHVGSAQLGSFDLLAIGDGATIGGDAELRGHAIEDGALVLGPITLGPRCTIGSRAHVCGATRVEADAELGALSMLDRGGRVLAGETWAGSPARRVDGARAPVPMVRASPVSRALSGVVQTLAALVSPLFVVAPIIPGLIALRAVEARAGRLAALATVPFVALGFVIGLCLLIVAVKWLVVGRIRPGRHALGGHLAVRWWLFDRAMKLGEDAVGALYATLWLGPFLRLLGVDLGARVEVSTASELVPDLLHVGDEAFVADATLVGAPRVARGTISFARTRVGRRAFVGNSAVVPAGTALGDDALLACMSIAPDAPDAARPGASWLGVPPISLPARQDGAPFTEATTHRPPRALVAARLAVELVRVVAPTSLLLVATLGLVHVVVALVARTSLGLALVATPLLCAAVGGLAALLVVGAKWALCGRHRAAAHPLWSGYVWRTELVNALHEHVADPLFTRPLLGTPLVAAFFRALGATIGRRAYLATTCLTEYDLITLGDDVCVGEECTLQPHLFEDRVMKTGPVHVADGASLGASSIVLYGGTIGAGVTLAALSLSLKGESLPAGTRWIGIPAVARRG